MVEYIDEADQADTPQWVKDLRKSHDEMVKELKAEKAARAALETKVRSTTIVDVLKAKGVRPSIAKYVQVDDVSDETVTAWLTANAEDFGITLGESTDGANSQQAQPDPFQQANLALSAKVADPATAHQAWLEELNSLSGSKAVNDFLAKGIPNG